MRYLLTLLVAMFVLGTIFTNTSCRKKETPLSPVYYDTLGGIIIPPGTKPADTLWRPDTTGQGTTGTTTGTTGNPTGNMSIIVTVRRGTIIGPLEAGATVYTNSNKADFDQGVYVAQNLTDANGEVTFTNLASNTEYYFFVEKNIGPDSLKGTGSIVTYTNNTTPRPLQIVVQ